MNFLNQVKNFSRVDLTTWLLKFKFVIDANETEDNAKCARMLPIYLEGEVLKIYLGLSEKTKVSFSQTYAHLKMKFSADPLLARHELDGCKLGVSEYFDSFAVRIRKLIDSPHPKFVEPSEKTLVFDKFIDAIPSEYLRHILMGIAVVDASKAIENAID